MTAGKGDKRRASQVSDEQYAERWDQIFHRKIDRVNAVADLVPTGWDNGLSQDYDKKLGKWFADQPGARQQIREMFEKDEE